MTYSEKLKDVRWQQKRLVVLQAANWKCEACDSDDRDGLQIHHSHYIKGRDPWEYELWMLHCLCPSCHVQRQQTEEAMKIGMVRLLRHVHETRLRMMAWKIIGDALAETHSESEQAVADGTIGDIPMPKI